MSWKNFKEISMKNRLYKKVFIALVALTIFTSCNDLFDEKDIEQNPNAPSDAPIDVLISGTLVGLAKEHEDTDVRLAYMWAGQLSGQSRQHASFGNYIVSSSTFDWRNLYPAASNARLIQQKAAAVNNKWSLGIGQVIEALLIAKATALWGDVPYSQAFDFDKYPKPVFDKQSVVYNELIATLEAAIDNLTNPVGISPEANYEFIYQGDVTKWAAAANTLLARLYLHLGDYSNAITYASNGINDPANDALAPHGEAFTVDNNLNYDFFENSRPGDTSFDSPAFLPTFMANHSNAKTDETALYNHFFQSEVYTGGLDPNTIDGFFVVDSYGPILTFNENQLILAEAYARRNAGGDLQSAVDALNSVRQVLATGFINGKTISDDYIALGLQYDDYVLADFAPAGIARAGKATDQEAVIYEIISQKYIVMLAQYETFTDLRRLAKATPLVELGITPVIGSRLPNRFIYPQNEINTNPTNVPKGSSGGVPDQFEKLEIF